MSKPPKADKRQYIRCPMCGKQPVQLKRDRIVSHLSPGGVKCIAIGFRPSKAILYGRTANAPRG